MTMNNIFHYTGLIFWVLAALVGLFYILDWLLWFVVDRVIKRLKLDKDLYAFMEDRWRKKNKNYPA